MDYMTQIAGDRAITWNFFATSHGKGAVDGIGGSVKRLVRTQVLSGGTHIQTAQQFAQTKCSGITLLHCCSTDIEAMKSELDERWKDLRQLTGLNSAIQWVCKIKVECFIIYTFNFFNQVFSVYVASGVNHTEKTSLLHYKMKKL
jgi:hypothetical protein